MRRSEISLRQIMHVVLIKIYTGKLSANQRLPSVRCFAKELHVSCSTVHSLYIHLKEKGVIYSVPNRGYFVSPNKRIGNEDLFAMRQCFKTVYEIADCYGLELLDALQLMVSLGDPMD